MSTNRLTDAKIRAAKPSDKVQKFSDGDGLQLWIMPEKQGGAKSWRFAYRFGARRDGKPGKAQQGMSFGAYPSVSLQESRAAREAARKLLAQGIDPAREKRSREAARALERANTFSIVANELIAKKRREEKADSTIGKMEWLLRLAEPALGSRPIKDVSAAEILVVLQQHEQRGHFVTAQHLRGFIGQVFRFAISTARAENDPTYALRGALTVSKVTHHPALTEPKEFGRLLLALDSYEGRAPELTMLLQLLALTFVRPGELRAAEWAEFKLDDPEPVWTIPASRMKGREEHRVYLARQALKILRELKTLTGTGRYVFPCTYGRRDRPMAANAINGALARLGYSSKEHTPHGFRASASSQLNGARMLDEAKKEMVRRWSVDAVEFQLAHVGHRSATVRAYDRDDRWPERCKLMIWWANECDRLRAEAGSTTQTAEFAQACAVEA